MFCFEFNISNFAVLKFKNYSLPLQRNRVEAMQSDIEYQGFGTRY